MLLIAHRGLSARAPENTLEAFSRALDAGCDGIETDVRLTADGGLVLLHDDELARTTGVRGRASDMRFADVVALGVPSLEEFLELCAGRTRMYLELKGSFRPDGFRSAEPVARAVAPLLQETFDVVVSSFDPTATALVREVAPSIPTGVGGPAMLGPDWALEVAVEGNHREVHVAEETIDVGFVARANAAGKAVLGWTVNDPARLRALRGMDVDGVFTDDVSAAREALRDD
ncbi:MAG TPA: glycerophosphodiester phosphodiesterase [Actinomycetota bacterium]|nr:glycerophosphodiester phosphodiesterase [Actinomycetota bacterium]